MFYLYYGDDSYTVRTQVAATQRRYAGDDTFAVQRLDGATARWGEIVAACNVLPFLASYQVVRVEGLIAASARRRAASGDDLSKPGASPAALAGLVEALPATTVLILEEGALQATNAHLKAVAALNVEKRVTPCAALEGRARVTWTRDEVARRGGAIDASTATVLADRLSGSLWPLSQAIDTLISYVGPDRPITRAAVDQLVAPEEDDNAFHLSDAIASRQTGRALTLLHTLMDNGMVEEQIVAMLVGRVRDWTLLAAFKAERVPEGEAAKRLGWKPSKYGAVARGVAAFNRGELPRAYQALVVTDEALKSRPGDERPLIVDMLVFTLATRGDPEGLRQTFPIPLVG